MLVYFPVLVCCTKANLATLPTSRTVVQNFWKVCFHQTHI
jgi:hypothetical protein